MSPGPPRSPMTPKKSNASHPQTIQAVRARAGRGEPVRRHRLSEPKMTKYPNLDSGLPGLIKKRRVEKDP